MHRTKQENNVVSGDQAGGNINKIYNYGYKSTDHEYMKELIERFKKEREEDKKFADTVEKLEKYMTNIDEEELIGLEEKLRKGGYDDLIKFAKTMKESYAKQLHKNQFYESAQQIHAFLLAEVYTRFNNYVFPKISDGASKSEIIETVQSKIIEPIQNILGENVLELFSDDINGMIYYLTGNCYINWV